MLSEVKHLSRLAEILRFAQEDHLRVCYHRSLEITYVTPYPVCRGHSRHHDAPSR